MSDGPKDEEEDPRGRKSLERPKGPSRDKTDQALGDTRLRNIVERGSTILPDTPSDAVRDLPPTPDDAGSGSGGIRSPLVRRGVSGTPNAALPSTSIQHQWALDDDDGDRGERRERALRKVSLSERKTRHFYLTT